MQKIFSIIVSFGAVSFFSCFIAELKKAKKKDVKWDSARLCYVPISHAFALGITALLCLTLAQIIGNIAIYRNYGSRSKTEDNHKAKEPPLYAGFLLLSWISFVVVTMILSTATSMSRTQPYGEGWLDEECYLVKDGIFTASGCLVLLTVGALLIAAKSMNKQQQKAEQDRSTRHVQELEQGHDGRRLGTE